ncbi:hypothetical protein KAR91_29220 [Candidatus Pacearchaeota archaeon]|nr:hypothetical protein [Candidatus Pacearchaeota archaeon]
MTMTLEVVEEKLEMDKTFLVQINPGQSTLPIDVASTWTQGFLYINKILEMIDKDTFVETFLDETGKDRRQTHIHPLLLPMMQERRRMIEQVWKISGGEIMNEAKKTIVKSFAKQIFESQLSNQKEQYKKEFIEIIENEVHKE